LNHPNSFMPAHVATINSNIFTRMKINEATTWLRKELEKIYPPSESASISLMVMEHLTKLSKSEQLQKQNETLELHALHNLTNFAHRLGGHEPVQYVLGECWFYGLNLFVDKNVLIPRAETEELVDWIIKDVSKKGLDVFDKKITGADKTTVLKILDVGTGSGCIALALKNKMPGAEVWGCDVSEEALNVARRNGSELNIRVDFQGVDFLDRSQQHALPSVDIIVSNPPYVPQKNKKDMQPNVLEYEPHTALFVPDNDALIFYKALADFGKIRLHEPGSIYMEIHEDLANEVASLFDFSGYSNVEIKKDMQGKDRMVKAEKH
jgi:release factor glutamine methyltransferase